MRDKILVVDDLKFNRQILINILGEDYRILEAENGREAFKIIEEERSEIAAMLLDIVMPEVNGVELLKMLCDKNYMNDFPILVVTSEQSLDLVAVCFDYGISDFIRKPVNSDFVKQRVDKLVKIYSQKNDYKERLERQMLTLKSQYKLLQQQATQLKQSNEKIIHVLGTIVEYRNMEERAHVTRVKEFTRILANHMMKDFPEYELTEEKINIISAASVLHDIGKIVIPDAILLKPGKLTNEEYEYAKSHSLRGYDIINSISDLWEKEYIQYSLEITKYHHEKYDGSGYPEGLKGDDIPVSAQIVAIADCFESLLSESVYKQAIEFEQAYNMILQGECGVFSFKLLECFRKAKEELEAYINNQPKEEETMLV